MSKPRRSELERLQPEKYPAWPEALFERFMIEVVGEEKALKLSAADDSSFITAKEFKEVQRRCRAHYDQLGLQIPMSVESLQRLENLCGVRVAASLKHEKTQRNLKVLAAYAVDEKKRHEPKRQAPRKLGDQT